MLGKLSTENTDLPKLWNSKTNLKQVIFLTYFCYIFFYFLNLIQKNWGSLNDSNFQPCFLETYLIEYIL